MSLSDGTLSEPRQITTTITTMSSPRAQPFGEWNTPKRAEIRALRQQTTISIREIGRVTGVPFTTVARILKFDSARTARPTRTGRPPIISNRDIRHLIRELQSGWSSRKLSLTALAR